MTYTSRPLRLHRIRRLPFAIEVALVVSVKLLLLAWLWNVFFSAPQTKKMRLPTAQVEQHLLPARHDVVPSSPPPSTAENLHDPHR
jgi:hypothetical protein